MRRKNQEKPTDEVVELFLHPLELHVDEVELLRRLLLLLALTGAVDKLLETSFLPRHLLNSHAHLHEWREWRY